MDPKYWLVISVAVIMGWFAFGFITNLRKGDKLARWLRSGLPAVGEKTTYHWLGSSVLEMVIHKARKPFRNLTTLLVFVPRDVPWMWVSARASGRRDTIIFRAQLGSPPQVSLELADPHSWTGRTVLRQLEGQGWEARPYNGQQLMAPSGQLDLAVQLLERLQPCVSNLSEQTWRIGLRKEEPQLELHLPLPQVNQVEAARYFQGLKDLAASISE